VRLTALSRPSFATGAALSLILQPDLFGNPTFTTQLREAVIVGVTVTDIPSTGKRGTPATSAPTIATAASTLKGKLAAEDTPLTAPEQALMEQWLTTLADAPIAAPATQRADRNARENGGLAMTTTMASEPTTHRWSSGIRSSSVCRGRRAIGIPAARCRCAGGRPLERTPGRRVQLDGRCFRQVGWSSPVVRVLGRFVHWRAISSEARLSPHETAG
jgi:hypothetical protein